MFLSLPKQKAKWSKTYTCYYSLTPSFLLNSPCYSFEKYSLNVAKHPLNHHWWRDFISTLMLSEALHTVQHTFFLTSWFCNHFLPNWIFCPFFFNLQMLFRQVIIPGTNNCSNKLLEKYHLASHLGFTLNRQNVVQTTISKENSEKWALSPCPLEFPFYLKKGISSLYQWQMTET